MCAWKPRRSAPEGPARRMSSPAEGGGEEPDPKGEQHAAEEGETNTDWQHKGLGSLKLCVLWVSGTGTCGTYLAIGQGDMDRRLHIGIKLMQGVTALPRTSGDLLTCLAVCSSEAASAFPVCCTILYKIPFWSCRRTWGASYSWIRPASRTCKKNKHRFF